MIITNVIYISNRTSQNLKTIGSSLINNTFGWELNITIFGTIELHGCFFVGVLRPDNLDAHILHSWQLFMLARLESQTVGSISQVPTQSHYPNIDLTGTSTMPSAWLGIVTSISLVGNFFTLTGNQPSHLCTRKPVLFSFCLEDLYCLSQRSLNSLVFMIRRQLVDRKPQYYAFTDSRAL